MSFKPVLKVFLLLKFWASGFCWRPLYTTGQSDDGFYVTHVAGGRVAVGLWADHGGGHVSAVEAGAVALGQVHRGDGQVGQVLVEAYTLADK